jgi:hypothetical protein
MLTAKTITDKQIRELLVEAPDVLTAQHCLVALGRCTYGNDADDGVTEARQHCATAPGLLILTAGRWIRAGALRRSEQITTVMAGEWWQGHH